MYKQFNNLYAPPDSKVGSVIEPKSMGKEDIIDFLGEDEPEVIPLTDDTKTKDDKSKKTDDTKKEDEEDETKEGDETETEDDELKEIEDELEGPTEEQLELVTPIRRKEILKKYPTLFKDFPYLEKAYYREQQFTEIFPTIDDAKEAIEKVESFDNFEKDMLGGNTETILNAIKSESPQAFNKVVDNYLSTLAKIDEKSYHHVIGNVIKHTILSMVEEARSSENEDLHKAAGLLNQFAFGKTTFAPPTNLSTNDDSKSSKSSELDEREKRFNQQRFDSVHTDLNTRVNNAYKSTIEANIDPKQSMSDYVRRTASRDALEDLEKQITKDTRFKVLVDKLWIAARKEDFSKQATDRIRSAFLSKAKTLLPSVIQKARREALKGMGKRVTNDSDDSKENPTNKRDKSSSNKEGDKRSSKDVPRGMSTLDFLMSDD